MLNKSSRYSIKDIEHLSNVKSHTIRIWEQRYKLLSPERTNTNIRFYDDEQLKKLLNVSTLLNSGMKISHISKLTDEEITKKLDTILKSSTVSIGKKEALLTSAIIAVLAYDEKSFEKIYNNSIADHGLITTYINVLYPLLVRTGQMWAGNSMLPAQEHFLSNILERKLHAAIDLLPLPKTDAETWLLFLTEGEEHELGLLIAHYILRKNRKHVIYLGRRLPLNNLYDVIRKCQPSNLYTFFIRNRPEYELNELLSEITLTFKKLNIFISGRKEIVETIKFNNRVSKIIDVKELIALINKDRQEQHD